MRRIAIIPVTGGTGWVESFRFIVSFFRHLITVCLFFCYALSPDLTLFFPRHSFLYFARSISHGYVSYQITFYGLVVDFRTSPSRAATLDFEMHFGRGAGLHSHSFQALIKSHALTGGRLIVAIVTTIFIRHFCHGLAYGASKRSYPSQYTRVDVLFHIQRWLELPKLESDEAKYLTNVDLSPNRYDEVEKGKVSPADGTLPILTLVVRGHTKA